MSVSQKGLRKTKLRKCVTGVSKLNKKWVVKNFKTKQKLQYTTRQYVLYSTVQYSTACKYLPNWATKWIARDQLRVLHRARRQWQLATELNQAAKPLSAQRVTGGADYNSRVQN